MKTKLFYLLAIIFISTTTFSQEREDIMYYDLYQFGSAKYTHTLNGRVNLSADDIKPNHMILDVGFTVGDIYFRLDTSTILGTFLDDLFSETKDTYLSPINLGIGYLLNDYPIKITENSDLVFGLGGFVDSVSLKTTINNKNVKESFGSYGFSILADYQLGDTLNLFTEYYNGSLKSEGAKSKKSELRTKLSYAVYGNLYLSFTASFKSNSREAINSLQELSASTYSIGIFMR